MRVKFEFEIDPRQTLDLEPADFDHVSSLDDLEMALLDQPEPSWRVFVDKDDLQALWDEVQKLRDDQ